MTTFFISPQVISELNGKDINEVMNAGKSPLSWHKLNILRCHMAITNVFFSPFIFLGLSKLASVPAGGAVAAPAAGGGTTGAGAAPAAGTC